MSSAAVVNGGAVASGSTVDILQSIGAAGLGTATGPVIVAGGIVGGAFVGAGLLMHRYWNCRCGSNSS